MSSTVHPRRSRRFLASALVAGVAVAPVFSASSASATPPTLNFAYIGDVPYTAAQVALLPNLVTNINSHAMQFTAHAGDTKGGSDSCSNAWMSTTQAGFKGLTSPFWVTPGDNDWTDCHRDSNGSYDPLERLTAFRARYYPVATETSPVTSGAKFTVVTQGSSSDPLQSEFIENTLFQKDCITFGDVHAVTSANGLLPPNDPYVIAYKGAGSASNAFVAGNSPSLVVNGGPLASLSTQAQRTAEATRRINADIAWVDAIFDAALANNSDGVFLMLQAEPALLADQPTASLASGYPGQNIAGNDTVSSADEFAALRAKIIARATAFKKPVVLTHGDQHTYTVTKNYAGVSNLTRLENPGSSGAATKWIEVAAACGTSTVFSQTLHTLATGTATDTAPAFASLFDAPLPTDVPEGSLALGLAGVGIFAGGFILVRNRRRASTLH